MLQYKNTGYKCLQLRVQKVFIKSHPTVQFDIQTLVWNKCKVWNDAHTATVMKLLFIFTLFSHKNLFLFNICSENYKCSSTHKKTWKLKLRRKNVLWLSAHMSLKGPTLHIGREFSLFSLTFWFVAPSMILCVHPTGTGMNSPMYIQCTFTVSLSH